MLALPGVQATADPASASGAGGSEPRSRRIIPPLRPPAPAAHRAWGPEVWPAEVRDNVKSWPPLFRERQLLALVRSPLARPARVAFVSNKDGVGKTTVARILHTIYSTYRSDSCTVLDINVDSGAELADGVIKSVPGTTDYQALITDVSAQFPLLLCDVGTGVGEAATRQVLDNCDQIVVVATPAVDGLYAASSCLDDLAAAGYGDLVEGAICAINRIRPMPFTDLLTIDRHFARRCRQVVRIPWDARSAAKAGVLDELRPTTRTGFFELAAAIVINVGERPHTTKPPQEEEENP